MAATKPILDVNAHVLVPKHELCTDKQKATLLKEHNITAHQLPRIKLADPAIQHLGVKEDDVVKITRPSHTAGETVFYRVVTRD
ncbi:MAG: DNA-directed RNA polymerase subunit H [Candidatus Woesearchaeota archaeon]|nr:DNA-directed RNA polymerase subunit H [Candidatus Woesearchaeota archaeon]